MQVYRTQPASFVGLGLLFLIRKTGHSWHWGVSTGLTHTVLILFTVCFVGVSCRTEFSFHFVLWLDCEFFKWKPHYLSSLLFALARQIRARNGPSQNKYIVKSKFKPCMFWAKITKLIFGVILVPMNILWLYWIKVLSAHEKIWLHKSINV